MVMPYGAMRRYRRSTVVRPYRAQPFQTVSIRRLIYHMFPSNNRATVKRGRNTHRS